MSELGTEFCLVCGSPPPLFGERMCETCLRKRIKLVEVPEMYHGSDVQDVVLLKFRANGSIFLRMRFGTS